VQNGSKWTVGLEGEKLDGEQGMWVWCRGGWWDKVRGAVNQNL